jgi:methionyl-tRNA synthetase
MPVEQGKKRFFLTTPIYYVNARPHLGTAYTTVIADIIARYKRMSGYEVLLVTGSDENSQKIVQAAREAGMDPLAFCDEMAEAYHAAWRTLHIGPYEYVRTTEPRHKKLVQHFFQRLFDNGYVYKGKYTGWYCTPCETFYTEKELLEGGLCPKCERPTHEVSEEAYFFRLSAFQDYLEELLKADNEFVIPDFRLNEMRSRVREGLNDVCISRSSLDWGIPLPWDDGHVFYVWVDALLAYVTGSGYDPDNPAKPHWWPAQLNLMAKDIPWFHAVIFPAMLKAYSNGKDGRELAHVVKMLVHGYWMHGESKMSKSKGGAVTPQEVIDLVGADGLRYFYAREIPLGYDGNISLEAIVNRFNYELGNDLGNLLNRLMNMTARYFGGVVPEHPEYRDSDLELAKLIAGKRAAAAELMDKLEFTRALEEIFAIIRECNRLIDTRKPWALGKQPDRAGEFTGMFCMLFNALKCAAVLLAPIMPESMQALWEQIGLPGNIADAGIEEADRPYAHGSRIGEPKVLFPRVELKEAEPEKAKPAPAKVPPKEETKMDTPNVIEYDEFAKVELIAAKVISAEKVQGADKLLKLQVDDGRGGRQIIAGIAQWKTPEEMVGLTIPIVANLKPAKLRGELSEGMLLAAQDGAGNLSVVVLQGDIAPGSRVK